jgi:galactokinase
MTGGGFGGCTINVVETPHAAEFSRRVAEGYRSATAIEADIHVCHAAQGVSEVLI